MTGDERYRHWLKQKFAPDEGSDIRAHLELLHGAARGIVVELGTDRGVSTAALLAGVETHGGTVLSIDKNPHCEAFALFNGHPQWQFVIGHSLYVDMPESIDVLLIDSSHEYPATLKELQRWGGRVKGAIFLHDCGNVLYPGVAQAIEEYMAEGMELTIHGGSFGMAEIRFK